MPATRKPGPTGYNTDVEIDFNKDDSADDTPEIEPEAAFKNIPRATFLQEVRERKLDPSKIHQKGSSLCGPSALMYLTAKYRPDQYAQYAIDLYETGTAWLGQLKISPGSDCKAFTPVGNIAGADWVTLAGTRDSENLIWDYDDEDDEVGGITLPSTLKGWLEKAGFHSLVNETNLYFTKGESNLRDAQKLRDQGYEVCFLINADGIQEADSRNAFVQIFTIPNHWVVLTSDITITDKSVFFDIFTWGDGKWRVPQPTGSVITLDTWLKNYYGYVACKP